MYLKRLEIHGFKSFAQKTTLEFSSGIIAIVGPNGSGKSNVADCLRWVLGEQSAKIIRGKKSDDVIFAGSDKKGKLGFAEVFATFDNSDRRIPVDSAEVSIGRRIDRSGESEYLINGNKVRLLDIIDLVLKSNIGTSRYTVIGQGTIDQMILAGPSEVKNLLDEASGVKTYYIRREKTLRRLEQTAQNLMRAEDLIAEIEPRLKSLRRQAKKMEARVEIEAELKMYQKEFFGKTFWDIKKVLNTFAVQLEVSRKEKESLELEIQKHQAKLKELEKYILDNSQQFGVQREDLGKLSEQKNKILEDLSLVRGKMQSQKTGSQFDPKTLQVEVHAKQRQISEVEEKIANAKTKKIELEKELHIQQKTLSEFTEKLDKLYKVSKNPAQIDWSLFDLELKALESQFTDFYTKLQNSQSVEEAKNLVLNLKISFEKFKQVAKQTSQNPQHNLGQFQHELETAMHHKELVSMAVSTAELDLSKNKVQTEFLEKELGRLGQEKLHFDLELKKASSINTDDYWQSLLIEEKRIQSEVDVLGKQILSAEEHLKAFYKNEEEKSKQFRHTENELRQSQDSFSKIKDKENAVLVEKAKYDTQMQILLEEIFRILGQEIILEFEKTEVVLQTPDLEAKIFRLKNQLDMIGGMDELTMKEYTETESRHTNLSTQVADLKKSLQDLRSIMDELDEHIKTKFNQAFHKINEKFEHYFRILFNGGRAYLSLLKNEQKTDEGEIELQEVEDLDAKEILRPEEKIVQKYEHGASNIIGVDIKATPAGKKLTSIQALSGGERSLTAIALLCSLLTCFPSPFVVLDEVDAALDDANTIRFGQILSSLAHQTQFITITHNRETMSQSNILYGVTMGDDGVSKLLSVKLEQAKAYAK